MPSSTDIFDEGYRAGYNQALVDKGFMTQKEADKFLPGKEGIPVRIPVEEDLSQLSAHELRRRKRKRVR